MRRGLKYKVIAFLAALLSVFALAGCGKLNDTLDDVLNQYDVKSQVTYYAGEKGWFGKEASGELVRTLDLYYKSAQKPFAVGMAEASSGSVSLQSDDYEIVGWKVVETDENGNPKFADESKTTPIVTSEDFDFSKSLEDGKHYHVAAVWQKKEMLDIKLLEGSLSFTLTEDGAETSHSYAAGDIIASVSYGTQTSISRIGNPLKTGGAYTFLEYYADAAGTTVASWPIQRNGTGENKVVYAKFLEGEWELLKTASDVRKTFTSSNLKGNYYLCNDIDCSSLSALAPLTSFAGTLNGNGHKISNLKFLKAQISTGKYAIFGEIKETASIQNITFENVSLTYKTRPGSSEDRPNLAELYFVFTKIENGATVENVTFDGGSVTVELSKRFIIENMMSNLGDEWQLTNWKFGGFASDEAYTGMTVVNVTEPAPPVED